MSENVGSDRWWLTKLMHQVAAGGSGERSRRWSRTRYSRRDTYSREAWLDFLWSVYSGDAPLPEFSREFSQPSIDFLRMSRTDYASTIVTALVNRLQVTGASTGDADMDDAVRRMLVANGSFLADAFEFAAVMGSACVLMTPGRVEGTVVGEAVDPRVSAWSMDPMHPHRVRAFLKVREDAELGRRRAFLYLTDAARDPDSTTPGGERMLTFESSNRRTEWDLVAESALPVQGEGLPVAPVVNRFGQGEFERSLDTLDRISDGLANRMWASKYLVHKMRGVQNAPLRDKDGNPIDYEDMLVADPASWSVLPEGAEFWESGGFDPTPLLSVTTHDTRQLSTETSTPMSMFLPDVNMSAAGANAATAAGDNKVEDRQTRWTPPVAHAIQWGLRFMGFDPPETISLAWRPAKDSTAAVIAAAGVIAQGVPAETALREVAGWGEEQIKNLRRDQQRDVLRATPVPGAPPSLAPPVAERNA